MDKPARKARLEAECGRLLKEAVFMKIVELIGANPDFEEWADEVEETVKRLRDLEWEQVT